MKHKENSITFWNEFFKDSKPLTIKKEDVKIENALDKHLKHLGDSCENILDIGCGHGTCLMTSKYLGKKMIKGIGFDSSQNAIKFANETTRLSKIEGLTFICSDESFFESIEDDAYDGIICSNFLDVIHQDLSNKIISEIKRILKPNGLFLLKLNFYLNDELIKKLNMIEIEKDTYEMNGVIRSYNLSTEAWAEKFKPFEVVSINGYQRAEHLPKDRVILFKNKE
jgi:SAM-dependent methyltransferase